MIEALEARLDAWANDPDLVCVLLRGSGPKAFCAGGDVRRLAEACREHPGEVPPLAARFFADEYRLDHRLHTYPKPLICWAHGHVLGGGMGLMQGAAIRIVTPSSRLGMPEVNIGLYPDVGGSWFLARLPGRLGLFLGLTASGINARDALDLGLADRFLLDEQQEALLDGLAQLNWREHSGAQLTSLLRALEASARPQLPEPSGCRAGPASMTCWTWPNCPPPGTPSLPCSTTKTPCWPAPPAPWSPAARSPGTWSGSRSAAPATAPWPRCSAWNTP